MFQVLLRKWQRRVSYSKVHEGTQAPIKNLVPPSLQDIPAHFEAILWGNIAALTNVGMRPML